MDIALGDAFELNIVDGDLRAVSGIHAVRQKVLLKLSIWLKDWALDLDFGVPYIPNVLGKQLSLEGVIATLREAILEIEGVESVSNIKYTLDTGTRAFSFSCSIHAGEDVEEVATWL